MYNENVRADTLMLRDNTMDQNNEILTPEMKQ